MPDKVKTEPTTETAPRAPSTPVVTSNAAQPPHGPNERTQGSMAATTGPAPVDEQGRADTRAPLDTRTDRTAPREGNVPATEPEHVPVHRTPKAASRKISADDALAVYHAVKRGLLRLALPWKAQPSGGSIRYSPDDVVLAEIFPTSNGLFGVRMAGNAPVPPDAPLETMQAWVDERMEGTQSVTLDARALEAAARSYRL